MKKRPGLAHKKDAITYLLPLNGRKKFVSFDHIILIPLNDVMTYSLD